MKEHQEHNLDQLRAAQGFLKWYRINSGLSQMELSELSGVHRNTISRYEILRSVNLSMCTILQICDALGLSLKEVFHDN